MDMCGGLNGAYVETLANRLFHECPRWPPLTNVEVKDVQKLFSNQFHRLLEASLRRETSVQVFKP